MSLKVVFGDLVYGNVFVCIGVIDFLVSGHPVAQVLRDHVVFKVVPMLNPDGVYLGNYRWEILTVSVFICLCIGYLV